MSALAKDLIQRLLMKDPKKRLGCGPRDADEIKEHLFFQVKFIEQISALLISECSVFLVRWMNMVSLELIVFSLFSHILHFFFFFLNDRDPLERIGIPLVET